MFLDMTTSKRRGVFGYTFLKGIYTIKMNSFSYKKDIRKRNIFGYTFLKYTFKKGITKYTFKKGITKYTFKKGITKYTFKKGITKKN
jgi:hypothetical protein